MKDFIGSKQKLDETNSVTGSEFLFILMIFLGILCIGMFMVSEFIKMDENPKNKIEVNGKTYVEE